MKFFTTPSGITIQAEQITDQHTGTIQMADDFTATFTHVFKPNNQTLNTVQWVEFKQMKYSPFTITDWFIRHSDGHHSIMSDLDFTLSEFVEVDDLEPTVYDYQFNVPPSSSEISEAGNMLVGTNASAEFATNRSDDNIELTIVPFVTSSTEAAGPSNGGEYSVVVDEDQEIGVVFAISAINHVPEVLEEPTDPETPTDPEEPPAEPSNPSTVTLDDIIADYNVMIYVGNGQQTTSFQLVKNVEDTLIVRSATNHDYVLNDAYVTDSTIQVATRVSFLQAVRLLPSYTTTTTHTFKVVATHKTFGTTVTNEVVVKTSGA